MYFSQFQLDRPDEKTFTSSATDCKHKVNLYNTGSRAREREKSGKEAEKEEQKGEKGGEEAEKM